MPITIEMGGVAVEFEKGSISIEKRIEERSTASFQIIDEAGSGSYPAGTPVEIFDSDLDTIFAGFVDEPGRQRIGVVGDKLVHPVSCIDMHYLADKRLVVKSYSDKTLEYIVEDILTDYLAAEGVTEGLIQTGPVIGSAIFNYVKASDAFDALKELSGYIWYIDSDKKLYFVDRATYTAPWNLDSSTYKPIKGSVFLDTANPLYRNRQYIRGGRGVTSSQVETFTGDGAIVAFTVGYPISSLTTVTVNAVAQTKGIKGLDSGKECYWNKGDATVTFAAAPGAVAVVITYVGEYPLIVRADSPAEIAARAAIEGATGIVEEIVTEAQHESGDAMRESAKAKITQYAQDAEKFTYQTHHSGLEPGQIQEITYSPFNFAAHEMLIEAVSVRAIGDLVLYDVSCITGPSMGSWTRFFSGLLARTENIIKIGDSLLLVLLLQAETLTLAEATDRHEDAEPCTGRWIVIPETDDDDEGVHLVHEKLALSEAPARSEDRTRAYMWG